MNVEYHKCNNQSRSEQIFFLYQMRCEIADLENNSMRIKKIIY